MSDTRAGLIRMLADGEVHSGETLGQALGVSRAAVSKSLRALPDLGLPLHQQAGRGYWLERPLALLDRAAIRAALGDAGARIAPLEVVDQITSTNDVLRRASSPRAPAFRALLAEFQTGGRGRQGKRWAAPYGGALLMSLAQTVTGGIGRVSGLSLVVGLAVRRALAELGVEDIGLKWPNDVFWRDRKLAGVLVELDGDIGGDCRWIAGIGLNWRFESDPAVDQPWVDLDQICQGDPPDRSTLAGAVLRHLVLAIDHLQAEGLAGLDTEWRQADVLAGRQVLVESPGADALAGRADGIDASGALRLVTAGGVRSVMAGTVRAVP